jgi:hypothetical protein
VKNLFAFLSVTFILNYAEPDLRRNIFGVLPLDWPPPIFGPPVVLLLRMLPPCFFFSRASRNFAFASSFAWVMYLCTFIWKSVRDGLHQVLNLRLAVTTVATQSPDCGDLAGFGPASDGFGVDSK